MLSLRLRPLLLALLALAVVVLGALPSRAAGPAPTTIAPELQAQLDQMTAGEQTTVIVTLRDQANLGQIGAGSRAARRRGVVQALRARARDGQVGLLAWLSARRARGEVSRVTPLWVFNGLSVTATAAVIGDLAARPEVKALTPDTVAIVPQGPRLAEPAEANLTLLGAPALWDLGWRGQAVVVAHLDTGVDVNHPDLVNRWRGGANSWFDPYGQYPNTPTDLNGHGTQTLGVIVGGNASGSAVGVAPQAQWIAARVFDNQGAATATAIHLAFQWVLDPDGNPLTDDAPQVVNNSWSFGGPGCNLEFQADLQALRAADIVPVFAAGNYGPYANTSVSPANYPEALAVGAIGNSNQMYGYSSRGPSACGEAATTYPDLAAPGINVLTTDLFGQYFSVTGTSLAAPHVSGALALLLSAYPNLTAAQQEAALWAGAVDLGAVGPDNETGRGRLDVLAAYQWLQNQPDATAAPPTATAAPPTATPVPPTATPAPPTATPVPPTATAVPEVIFADGFEAGNLAAWTAAVTDGGDLSVTAGAGLTGGFGLQAVLNNNTAIYVTDDTPVSEPRYRARFYFDPNSLTMAAGNAHYILYGYAGTSLVVTRVELRFSASSYQLRASVINDAGAWANTAWTTIADAPHGVEVDWRAATAAGANNGGVTLWIDGVQRGNLATIDNDTHRIDRARLGAIAGIDTATRGTYFFDAFESRRLSYIGPLPPTATPVPPTATALPPTATPAPPTATALPPTATPLPPTATALPPTATPLPPTATPLPPTATALPPTATPAPPTATPAPPTATPMPPTATAVPPTATSSVGSFALTFDGVNDLAVGAAVPGTGAFTAEVWVRPTAAGETGVLISTGDADLGWSIELENGRPVLWVATSQGWRSVTHTTALAAGQWTHVAATYDGASGRLFVNGVAGASGTIGVRTASAFWQLGGVSGYPFFAGALDELRLSSVVRYSGAFTPAARFTPDAATVGLWHLDDGVGQAALDASTAGNHLVLGLTSAAEASDPAWGTPGR